ncbi:hypothetical protein [Streptomyces sp. NPDC018833]|uniref:hypothetical protein n=1 Tax=Streptomyces sp. NPDC018833 TaxID=3365053 RepID=UPI0037943F74
MSRETDSSSSGPQGGGGAAYPSGTPPYGSRQYPSLHPTQDAPDEGTGAASPRQPEEKKTETTLTTRIRINIPGSRPIPPVVMRTPMSDTDAGRAGSGDADAPAGERESERTGGVPRPAAAPDTAGTPAPAAEGKAAASDWFAPRKSAPPATSPQGGGPASGGGPVPSPQGGSAAPGGPGANGSGAGAPFGPGADDGAPRKSGLAALAEDAGPAPALPTRPRPGSGTLPGTGTPYFPDGPQPGRGSAPGRPGAGQSGNGFAPGRSGQGGAPGQPGPGGVPGQGGNGFAPGRNTPPLGVRPPGGPGRSGPAGPTTGPATGNMPLGGMPGGPGVAPRMSDDTAVLTPQTPASEPGGGYVSGDTLTSGIPVVPEEHRSPFPTLDGPHSGLGAGPDAGLSHGPHGPDADFSAPEFPAGPGAGQAGPAGPVSSADATSASRSAPAGKGRSKLMLAGAGVVAVLGIAYGAGLLLNHSDVPKSTTVLGVDIGGGTRDEAVNKLDAALGERARTPLQLSVGGKKVELGPDKAGLSLDSQATVRAAAGSDYNPVSVIGSLFGGERVAEPVILVDEEKLSVALADLAGTSGSATDGTIRFEPGKAVAVPGKAGQTLDVGRSVISVKDAYRAQVETGKPNVVELPVATREPTITQAELDRAMKEFAQPAMSGLITIKAGDKSIQFGPAKSLPQILSMKAIDGRLVEVYDKQAIEQLLDGVFDGIMITKGDGKQHQVSADDVAQAMGPALRGKTPAQRTAVISLNPS